MYSKVLGTLALAGLAQLAAAVSGTTAYLDSNTGIDFQQYADTDVGFSFGIAVPENPTTDFIGQLVVPLTDSAGWGAIALGPGMTGRLLLVAWPNDDEIVSTFRYTSAYSNPDVYTNSTLSALPIANGTFVNSTHFSFTFLCEGCVIGGSTTFDFSAGSGAIGYAVSSSNPTTPSDPASALVYHDVGANIYLANFTAAESADYETWASWASATTTTPTTPTNGTNSTTPSTGSGSNSTVTTPTTLNTTYDVIVVGGGTAGIIAAERLAEAGSSVLLIERGPANTVDLGSSQGLSWNTSLTPYDIPALGSSLSTITGTKFCSDTASTAGCLLGGSSSINGLNFIRPAAHDFENWPTGWEWDSISEAADRLYERNPGTTQPSADGKHYNDLAFTTWSAYLGKQGWNEVDSIESPNEKHAVFSRPAWSISNHLRAGPARTYMPFAQQLDNFSLKLETNVIQVLRNGSAITGVLTEADDGTTQIINLNANGKVVLAAGALSSPRVLWNSGIGRSDALNIVKSGTSGVSLPDSSEWIDLPVGHNLMDHAQVPLQFTAAPTFTAFDFKGLSTSPEETDLDLYEDGSGTITQAAQRMHLWTSVNGTDGVTRYLQGTVSAMADDTVTVKVFLTHGSTSRGELGISSSGSTILNTKPWLQTDDDMAVYSDFIQSLLDMTASNSTSGLSNSSYALSYSTSGATPSSIISSSLVSGDHWVGSAKMGTDDGRVDNGTSVVDINTKVYGTDNLFVVDASIHPDLPTGNTQAIIMIAAEQAAAKISAYQVTTGSGNSTTTPTTGSSSGSGTTTKCRKRKRSVARQQVSWHS